MPEQHVTLLKAMGLPDDQIEIIEKMTPEQFKEFKAEPMVNTIRGGISAALLNDQEFLNKIPAEKVPEAVRKMVESGQYGRFMNEAKDTAKLMGIDLNDATEEEMKSFKKLLVKMITKHSDKVGGKDGLKTLQDELLLSNQKFADLQKTSGEELEKKVGETKTGYESRITKLLLQNEVATLPEIELTVPAGYLVGPIMDKLKSRYHIQLDDTGEGIQLMQKAHPNLQAMTKDGTKPLTIQDALTEIVLADKVGKKIDKKQQQQQQQQTIVEVDNEGGEINSHVMEKIKGNLKEPQKTTF